MISMSSPRAGTRSSRAITCTRSSATPTGSSSGARATRRYLTVWRSCAKPFQLFSFLESGGFDACGWGSEELALACASHGGEPEHVALAARMLESIGLEEGDLACGAHEPTTRRGVRLMHQAGLSPSRLHNNCSGKHAGMLAYARTQSWSTLGYERLGHEVQDRALAQIARWSGSPRDDMELMVDGCGVVAVGLPLAALASAFARLGAAAERGEEVPARILAAIAAHPFLFGGTDRFDTVLVEEIGRAAHKQGRRGRRTRGYHTCRGNCGSDQGGGRRLARSASGSAETPAASWRPP